MATPKTWTAVDVKSGKIQIWRDDDSMLHIERPYIFVDAQGDKVPVGTKLFREIRAWADTPLDIREALQTLDSYIYDQILIAEDMEE